MTVSESIFLIDQHFENMFLWRDKSGEENAWTFGDQILLLHFLLRPLHAGERRSTSDCQREKRAGGTANGNVSPLW